MTSYLSQYNEVIRFVEAAERAGINPKESVRRILRSDGTVWTGNVKRKLWSDFQKLMAWATWMAPELPEAGA